VTTRLITVDELLEAPTGFDWPDVSETIASASAAEQLRIIDRASDEACRYIYGTADARLDATSDTELRRLGPGLTNCWVERNGALVVRCTFFPVLAVQFMSWAFETAGNPNPQFNALDTTKVLVFGEGTRKRRIIDTSQDWSFLRQGGQILTTYTNGWPNALLTSAIAPGSNVNAAVDTSVGFGLGQPQNIGATATIFDGANTENVTIASAPDATHVMLASVAFNHAAGIGISAVPPALKWGVVLACLHFGRTRGSDAVTFVGASGGPAGGRRSQEQPMDALEQAHHEWDYFKIRS
jgi:hypothetical protein